MKASELITEIQKLIKRGTINSNAEIKANTSILCDHCDCEEYYEFDDIQIDSHASTYNELILTAE